MKKLIKREQLTLNLSLQLVKRNYKKYFKIVCSINTLSLFRICPLAKSAYFFCRFLDDCADNDIDFKNYGYVSFTEMIDRFKHIINNPSEAKKPIELLIQNILIKSKYGNSKQLLFSFIDAMSFEYCRRKNNQILSHDQLISMHLSSFKPVLEIAFQSLNTSYSESLLFDLALIQASVYSIQDLEQDLKNGIINIPHEIIESFKHPLSDYLKAPSLLKYESDFLEWKKSTITKSREKALTLLNLSHSSKTKKIVHSLLNPIIKDTKHLL